MNRWILLVLLCCVPGRAAQGPTPAELRKVMGVLKPLHQRMGPPLPGDWLTLHRETGQTFRQYLACDPALPRGARRTLYLQPLGTFGQPQRRVVDLTAECLGLFFNLPVKVLPDLAAGVVPPEARRVHPRERVHQVLAPYVLHQVLKPRLPKDAAALLALTAVDLWPGEGWNFVFGQASLGERVGVWSLARLGDPGAGEGAFRRFLLRTLATATHETAHMFSLQHCIAYACGMNGSESLEEADRQPFELCPECLAKVCWATGTDPLARARALAAFFRREGLPDEAATYERAVARLEAPARRTSQ